MLVVNVREFRNLMVSIQATVAEWLGVSAQAPSPASSNRAARFELPTWASLGAKRRMDEVFSGAPTPTEEFW